MSSASSSPRFHRGRRQALQLLGTTAFSWTLAAYYANDALAQPVPAVAAPAQLRIGYQKSAVNLVVLKQHGVLEKRFPGTKISWLEFPAGPQLLEALSAGSLDFGLTGDSPPVFAQAAGKDLRYVGAEPPKPESSAILVLADSPLKTLADLKGRRVALQKAQAPITCWCVRWTRPVLPGPTFSPCIWPRPMRVQRSSAQASMPGPSGTRSMRPPS
jgi:sulfonate transport system substrate-binding protein